MKTNVFAAAIAAFAAAVSFGFEVPEWNEAQKEPFSMSALAYVIEALCGVSDADMLFDWELTALANPNVRFSHEKRYDRLVEGFSRYPGATARERAEAFVGELGFTAADVEKLREFFLEDAAGD